MTKLNVFPRLALTLGEPAGIGPDVCIQAAQHKLPAEVVVVGSPDLLLTRAKQLGLPLTLENFDPHSNHATFGEGRLAIIPIDLSEPAIAGELNKANARYVLDSLEKAHQLCEAGICQAMITAPVHKALIQQSGVAFSGHTEYLAMLCGVKHVLMTFHTPDVVVAMTTTHLPLKTVAEHITAERLHQTVVLLHNGLQQLFQIAQPRIHVCGLNPHAGENGTLGDEEIRIVIPTLENLREQGYHVIGPVSGDTAFTPTERQAADAIVAMYHDQGLAPIKALYFEQIVNVTMGLPYLRTSVDHGTALPLAGTGRTQCRSLLKAIELAAKGART